VSPLTRERAQACFTRALDASRVLLDAERRALYDAMLGRRSLWRTEALCSEDQAVLLAERARAAFRRGEYVTAAALFRAALQREADDIDMLAMLGRTRRLACPDDPTAGEAELARAAAIDPDAEFPLYWLARAHYERGELDASRALLRRILAHNPEFELAREAMRLFP
jgi:tetratricopeptide (TPR) repeat protein